MPYLPLYWLTVRLIKARSPRPGHLPLAEDRGTLPPSATLGELPLASDTGSLPSSATSGDPPLASDMGHVGQPALMIQVRRLPKQNHPLLNCVIPPKGLPLSNHLPPTPSQAAPLLPDPIAPANPPSKICQPLDPTHRHLCLNRTPSLSPLLPSAVVPKMILASCRKGVIYQPPIFP
jgi:hypothetical protein